MNEFERNDLWNGEAGKPEETAEPELPVEEEVFAEAASSEAPESSAWQSAAAEPTPAAESEEAMKPENFAQPESAEQPESAAQPKAAEPSYQDYFYASGPIRTARPAQDANPRPGGVPNYGVPGYGAQGYGAPNYSAQGYGAPNYGASNYGAPDYGGPYYVNPHYSAPRATQPQAPQPKQKNGFWKKAVALALACTLLGGGAGVGGALLVNNYQEKSSGTGTSTTAVQVAAPKETKELNVVTVDSGKLMTAAQVYKNNVNSTVGITTEITTTNFWGYQSTGAAAGSGFILTEDGYILTNEHVIEDANSITVAMYDGTSYPAKLIGYDASNDIAVLKIEATGLTPVTLGDSDALEVGDEVVAIGNPLGELTFSLTKGNVSALNRAVTLSRNVTMNLIQTDTAINSGNSGGALFNMYGEVVGITNAKYSSSSFTSSASIDNIGFAIPINSVRSIVSSIIEKGYISTPYIGVSVDNVGEESQSYGMPQGASIRAVEKDSPAEKAGIQANDIVTAVDGETITSYESLKSHVTAAQPGDELLLTIYRKGETLTVTVTVGERTQSALPQSESGQSVPQGQAGGMPWYPENP